MAVIQEDGERTPRLPAKSEGIIRSELREMIESRTFAQGSRLARFLQFVVEQYLSGQTDRLKETVIGMEVYDRAADYDPKVDSIVRTEARRLRRKLQEYYETEGRYSRVTITVPTGGYVPRIDFRPQVLPSLVVPEPAATKEEITLPARPRRLRLYAVILLSALVCGGGFWWILRHYYGNEGVRPAGRYTANKEAYRLYAEGRFYWAKRTPDFVHEAIARFNAALRVEPNYAIAYSGLADAYAVSASGLPASERWTKAKWAAERALALDPSLAEAHTSLAFILYKFEWNWLAAESHFRRALQLNPNYVLAHHWFGEFLVLLGRTQEGLAQLKQAESLDPLSLPTRNDFARALYRTRRYDDAITEAQHVLDLDPNFSNAYATLTYAYEQKHDYARAVKADLNVLRLAHRSEDKIAALQKTFADSGWQAYWESELDLLQKGAPADSVPAYVFAEIYLRMGNREQALHLLEKSFENRGDAPLLIGVEPFWDPVRSDQRFAYLLRRAGLPQADRQ